MRQDFFKSLLFQALWLDVCEESVKAAKSLGMTAVHITDVGEAVNKMEKLTGIKVTNFHPHFFISQDLDV